MSSTPQDLAKSAESSAKTKADAVNSFPTRSAREDGSDPNYVSMDGKKIKVRGGGGSSEPPKMHTGGIVPKDGVYTLQAGEKVIPKDKSMAKSDASFYRSMHHLRKGGLHDALHIPKDEHIPADRLAAAKNSPNPHVKKMAVLAANMKHWG